MISIFQKKSLGSFSSLYLLINILRLNLSDVLFFFFLQILKSFKLPPAYTKGAWMDRHLEPSSVAQFIVANLGGGSATMDHLKRLHRSSRELPAPLKLRHMDFYYPGDPQQADALLQQKVQQGEKTRLMMRVGMPRSPPEKRLTEDDIDQLVEWLLEPTLTAIFGKGAIQEAISIIGRLAALRPSLVIPKFLDLFYPALVSSSEPERLHATLSVARNIAYTLVSGGTDYQEGKTHILPILKHLLPGYRPQRLCQND